MSSEEGIAFSWFLFSDEKQILHEFIELVKFQYDYIHPCRGTGVTVSFTPFANQSRTVRDGIEIPRRGRKGGLSRSRVDQSKGIHAVWRSKHRTGCLHNI